MDETNKVKYEQLQGLLDSAHREMIREQGRALSISVSPSSKKEINQPVKQDRAIAKVIQQRRQQLQEMSPENRTLSIMRSALRVAREKRKHDATMISEKLEARKQVAYEALMKKSPLVEEAVQEAKGRDMLVKETLVNRHGQELIIERRYVKDREPYQKRPTTRAIKKHRQKSRGISL